MITDDERPAVFYGHTKNDPPAAKPNRQPENGDVP